MKKYIGFFLFLWFCVGGLAAGQKPDFIPADILVKPDQFIYIKLQNRSPVNVSIPANIKEKIFLTIYIDNIKRAEYKLKYMDQKLFKPKGTILFRTNFRVQKGLCIKAQVNRLKIIPESNFSNNTLSKKLDGTNH